MKKFFVMMLIVLIASPAFAQARGALTNTYATWVSTDTTMDTITLPANSRDVWVHNGSAVDVCISLRGDTITGSCMAGSPNSVFQLNGTADFYAQDFVTDTITVISATGATASPVSVVVTY